MMKRGLGGSLSISGSYFCGQGVQVRESFEAGGLAKMRAGSGAGRLACNRHRHSRARRAAHLEVPVQEGVGGQAQQVQQPVGHGGRAHAQEDLGHHERLGDHLQRATVQLHWSATR